CDTQIRWYDNVPVVSYLLLRGRCRRCGTRIPPRDLAIELSTALLLAGCVLAFGFSLKAAAAGIACGAFVVVTATDLGRRIVPSLVLIARHGVRARRLAIPFAPFLCAGAVVALFAGEPILHAYLGVLR